MPTTRNVADKAFRFWRKSTAWTQGEGVHARISRRREEEQSSSVSPPSPPPEESAIVISRVAASSAASCLLSRGALMIYTRRVNKFSPRGEGEERAEERRRRLLSPAEIYARTWLRVWRSLIRDCTRQKVWFARGLAGRFSRFPPPSGGTGPRKISRISERVASLSLSLSIGPRIYTAAHRYLIRFLRRRDPVRVVPVPLSFRLFPRLIVQAGHVRPWIRLFEVPPAPRGTSNPTALAWA